MQHMSKRSIYFLHNFVIVYFEDRLENGTYWTSYQARIGEARTECGMVCKKTIL